MSRIIIIISILVSIFQISYGYIEPIGWDDHNNLLTVAYDGFRPSITIPAKKRGSIIDPRTWLENILDMVNWLNRVGPYSNYSLNVFDSSQGKFFPFNGDLSAVKPLDIRHRVSGSPYCDFNIREGKYTYQYRLLFEIVPSLNTDYVIQLVRYREYEIQIRKETIDEALFTKILENIPTVNQEPLDKDTCSKLNKSYVQAIIKRFIDKTLGTLKYYDWLDEQTVIYLIASENNNISGQTWSSQLNIISANVFNEQKRNIANFQMAARLYNIDYIAVPPKQNIVYLSLHKDEEIIKIENYTYNKKMAKRTLRYEPKKKYFILLLDLINGTPIKIYQISDSMKGVFFRHPRSISPNGNKIIGEGRWNPDGILDFETLSYYEPSAEPITKEQFYEISIDELNSTSNIETHITASEDIRSALIFNPIRNIKQDINFSFYFEAVTKSVLIDDSNTTITINNGIEEVYKFEIPLATAENTITIIRELIESYIVSAKIKAFYTILFEYVDKDDGVVNTNITKYTYFNKLYKLK